VDNLGELGEQVDSLGERADSLYMKFMLPQAFGYAWHHSTTGWVSGGGKPTKGVQSLGGRYSSILAVEILEREREAEGEGEGGRDGSRSKNRNWDRRKS